NLSNHPVESWSENQLAKAKELYGNTIDIKFPDIAPEASLAEIIYLVNQYIEKCLAQLGNKNFNTTDYESDAIHVMGEMTFVFQFVRLMSELGISCVASTTKRKSTDAKDGIKTSQFEFVQFRPYTEEFF
ncbi:CRISPR-associated protein, partial [candidate division KSB1 bacterium]|nr:CRISPR-associated protein [candidate division KSB1 bacterium]